METEKDTIAIDELGVVIERLTRLWEDAKANVGKRRPVIYSGEIELIKEHLDLVVKYSRI